MGPVGAEDKDASAGHVFRVLGEAVALRVTAAATGGAYSLFDVRTPRGQGMPPRRQHLEDTALCVVAGVYAVRVGDETRTLGTGACVFVPRGVVLAHRSIGPRSGRLLLVVSPGGIYERFLIEVGATLADRTAPDAGKVFAAAPKYGIEFLDTAPGKGRLKADRIVEPT